MFDSNDDDDDVQLLREHVTEPWLPLALCAQLLKNKVKDSSHYKHAGRTESNVFSLEMAVSDVVPEMTNPVKESDDFKNRKGEN